MVSIIKVYCFYLLFFACVFSEIIVRLLLFHVISNNINIFFHLIPLAPGTDILRKSSVVTFFIKNSAVLVSVFQLTIFHLLCNARRLHFLTFAFPVCYVISKKIYTFMCLISPAQK